MIEERGEQPLTIRYNTKGWPQSVIARVIELGKDGCTTVKFPKEKHTVEITSRDFALFFKELINTMRNPSWVDHRKTRRVR